MPERAVQLSDLEPAVAATGAPTPVPGSDIEVMLVDYRYGRGVDDAGNPTTIKWAVLTFGSPCHDDVCNRFVLDETHEVFGRRLYITGSRSQVLVYALPEDAPPAAVGRGPE